MWFIWLIFQIEYDYLATAGSWRMKSDQRAFASFTFKKTILICNSEVGVQGILWRQQNRPFESPKYS